MRSSPLKNLAGLHDYQKRVPDSPPLTLRRTGTANVIPLGALMTGIKLMAEYGGTVLWHHQGSEVGPIDIDELPLSQGLKLGLQAWGRRYDRVLNQGDPAASNWPSAEAQMSFVEDGRVLAKQLKEEVGSSHLVVYFNDVTSKIEAV